MKEMKLKLIVINIWSLPVKKTKTKWFRELMHKINMLTGVIYRPGPDISIRWDRWTTGKNSLVKFMSYVISSNRERNVTTQYMLSVSILNVH